jgi:hypothetical protein
LSHSIWPFAELASARLVIVISNENTIVIMDIS